MVSGSLSPYGTGASLRTKAPLGRQQKNASACLAFGQGCTIMFNGSSGGNHERRTMVSSLTRPRLHHGPADRQTNQGKPCKLRYPRGTRAAKTQAQEAQAGTASRAA